MFAGLGLLGVAALLAFTGSSRASAARSAPVRVGTAPRHPAGSKVVGSLPGATRLSLAIALKPRDPVGLATYATEVATPGSAVYHDYLTVAEFRRRFGPAGSTVNAVKAELRDRGLAAGSVSGNGLAIAVSAKASAVAHALSISFERVRLASGRLAYANTAAPQFPASVAGAVQGVMGLDSLARAVPLGVKSPIVIGHTGRLKPRVVTGGPQPCTAAVSDGSTYAAYTADQLASAYEFSNLYDAGDLGSGQTVALFELEPYSDSDISTYQACYGTSTSVSNVSVDGGAGTGAGSGEAALDIEDVLGLAPAASVRVYEGPNTNAGVYDTYNQIISDDVAKVISTSWGECEATEGLTAAQSENTLFQEAAAQGQSVFAAAGDSGSADCGGRTLAVDDPASQPYVTGVGGTTLSAIGPPPTESVWNDGKRGGAGGGGISSLWTMPSYQSGASGALNVVNSNSSGSPCGAGSGSYCREVPDVSADADENTGYVIYYKGSWTAFGGTSAAAPLWAAFTALANASSACGGKSVGFANPVLYAAAGQAYASDFNDITSGDNNPSGSGLYAAGTAYDMASGLGTPIGSMLSYGLCGVSPPQVTLTSPANGLATSNPKPALSGAAGTASGDSSTVTVKIYSGSNPSGSPAQTLTATQSGGSWSAAPSTALADGTYTAQAQQTNTDTGLTGYSSAVTFMVDTVAPTGSVSYLNGYANALPVSVSFSASDAGSGVDSALGQLQRASAPLSDGVCGVFGGFANVGPVGVSSPYSDSGVVSGDCYEYRYVVPDNAGNRATITSPDVVKLDTVAPVNVLSLAGASNAYLNGSTLYWNGNGAGGFQLVDSVTDSASGPASASFPAVGTTGWTHGAETVSSGTGSAPTVDYTSSEYSWTAGAADPADQTITGSDAAGNQVATSLHFVDDTTGPSGGSVDAAGLGGTGSRYANSTTLSVAFSKGSDSQSGVSATGAQLERASATLSSPDGQADGSCGTYSAYTVLATGLSSPYADSVTGGHCYKYEYVVSDNVGNQTTYTSGDVKVQTTAPASLTPAVTLSNATGDSFIDGATVYTNPQAGRSGGFTVSATSSDATSGIANVAFPNLGPGYAGGGAVSASPYTATYSWAGTAATGSGSQDVTATDNAGLSATSSPAFTVRADTTAPSGSVSYASGNSSTVPVSVSFSATDGGSGVDSALGQLQRASAPLSGGVCGTFSAFANVGPAGVTSPYSDASVVLGHCYEYRYLVSDNVGNRAILGPSGAVLLGATTHPSPVSRFTFSPSSPLTGQAVAFNGGGSSDADGTIESYVWSFGDGSGGTGATATHTYTKPGAYTVRLSVKDNWGSLGVTTRSLTVSPPPALKLTLRIPRQRLRSVLKHGLRLSTSSSQAASAKLQLVLSSRNAKRLGLGDGRHPVVIATLRRRLTAGALTAVRMKLTRRARNHLRTVRAIRLTVRLTAIGTGGRATISRRLLLRR